MRSLAAFVITIASATSPAFADEPTSIHEGIDETEHEGPWLHFDPMWLPTSAGLGAESDRKTTAFQIGKQLLGEVEGQWWKNEVDVEAKGWRAAFRLSHDFKWFRVEAGASVNHYDSRYEHRSYRDVSLSISKTHRFSRWMTGWISLSLGSRKWLGDDAAPTEMHFMLNLGTTFR